MEDRGAVQMMTRDELLERGENDAQTMLGVSLDEAFAMIDRGELRGTVAEAALNGLRFLLGADDDEEEVACVKRVNSDEEQIERIAEVIYLNEGGMSPEDHEGITGKPRRKWKTDAPWDSRDDELCEWERDEYRRQAEMVLKEMGKPNDT